MHTPAANDTKRNFSDDQALEIMKADYLEHCFKSAKEDLAKGNVVDGEDFLHAL